MKKGLLAILALGLTLGAVAPAKADVVVQFSTGRHWHRPHPVYWHRPYYRPPFYRAYYGPPPVIVAPAPVVYETRVIERVPATLPANATSETYIDDNGRTCREYESTVMVAGHAQSAYGTACLQPDGVWRVTK